MFLPDHRSTPTLVGVLLGFNWFHYHPTGQLSRIISKTRALFQLAASPHHRSTEALVESQREHSFNWLHRHTTGQRSLHCSRHPRMFQLAASPHHRSTPCPPRRYSRRTVVSIGCIATPPVNTYVLSPVGGVGFQLAASPHHRSTSVLQNILDLVCFNWLHRHTTGQPGVMKRCLIICFNWLHRHTTGQRFY